MMGSGWDGWGGMGWGGMNWFGGGWMLLVGLVVVLVVIWALRAFLPAGPSGGGDPALEVLRRRYAAGEITQAEFEQARQALGPAGLGTGRGAATR